MHINYDNQYIVLLTNVIDVIYLKCSKQTKEVTYGKAKSYYRSNKAVAPLAVGNSFFRWTDCGAK